MDKKILPLSLALVLTFAVGCGGKKLPEGVLGHDQMVDFLTDAYLLEGYYAVETNYTFDTIAPEFARAYDDLLEYHGISRDEVEASLDYYSRHPEPYNAICKEVEARIDEKTTESKSSNPVVIELAPTEKESGRVIRDSSLSDCRKK